jgi:predicted AAA+ superfamily ATPase
MDGYHFPSSRASRTPLVAGHEIPGRPVFGSGLRARLGAAFDTYLQHGGFPEVQGGLSDSLRREILQDYLNVVVLRDVIERHGVTNVPALRALLRHLLQSPGGRFSVHRFMNSLKSQGIACGKNLIHECLAHLAEAYLFYPVEVHSRSVRQRQVNPRKVYTIDPGLSHAVSLAHARDREAALESCVFMALRRRGVEIDYGITPGGNEVDFVFEDDTGKWLVQSAWSLSDPGARAREVRALEEALDMHMGNRAAVVTAYEEEGFKIGRHKVRVVPAWRWLLEQEAGSFKS